MAFDVRPEERLGCVYQEDVQMFSGGYREVEDWLNLAEDSNRLQIRSRPFVADCNSPGSQDAFP